MHLYLPFSKKDIDAFRRCAIQIGFDEFVLHKFLYSMLESDVDIYQLMYDERISLLLYGWEICDIHMHSTSNSVTNKNYTPTKNVQMVIKFLARYSLDLYLSREWDSCDLKMCQGLLYCMRRVEHILTKLPDVGMLNWDDIFKCDMSPWTQPYVSKFLIVSNGQKQTLDQSIEEIEQPACKQDIDYLRDESIFLIMARLVKMIDSFYLEGAKQLSMRVIAAWNAIYERARDIPGNITPQIPTEYKQCVINICHIYLVVVYEMDSNLGFVIDNMMNNIRFYHQSFLERNYDKPFAAIAQLAFTPARFIALTCINLNVCINKFIEMFINQLAEKNFSTLFGVISQSYISYILGNQLMEMNNMNEEHFNENIERYKSIFNIYIKEREISEMYLKDQLLRQKQQRTSHSMSQIVKVLTDFESKFCKGNRSCNIGNYENGSEDAYVQATDSKLVRDQNTDAIFENIPNNEEILNYVYCMLADRTYDGWHCAKIVLLLKIIGIEVNVIETWRYHPGLTINFMLGIETKLSKHYEDLALLFHEHFFLEQEFWLTAFYLNPIRKYYTSVIRCGMRFQRILHHVDGDTETNVDSADKNYKIEKNAKYGLLSSTIDVKEIVKIRNHDTPNADYDALSKSLSSLKLSEQTVKDLLTVTFLPRNKSFAWAVNWEELRKRCKKLLKVPQLKRRLVELNMAEANDRLKFLNINYEKYKNRPQLDYGSIEEGYENVLNFSNKEEKNEKNSDDDVDDDDDDDIEDDDDDEDNAAAERNNHLGFDEYDDEDDDEDDDMDVDKSKVKNEKRLDDDVDAAKPSCQDIDQLVDMFSIGTRRTRARTAAALASANMNIDRSKIPEKPKYVEPEDLPTPKKSPMKVVSAGANLNSDAQTNVVKRNLKELLQERCIYNNTTPGFKPFPDIWDFDGNMLQTVDKTSAVLTETENLFEKFSNLKTNTTTPNASQAELGSPNNEGLLDETTLSATEYDIHEVVDFDVKNNTINEVDFDEEISQMKVFAKQTGSKDAFNKEITENKIYDKVVEKEYADQEVATSKEVINEEDFDKETSSVVQALDKEDLDKKTSVILALDEEDFDKETSIIQASDEEDFDKYNAVIQAFDEEMEETNNKVFYLNEFDQDCDKVIIDLDKNEQEMDIDTNKTIELNETEQDMEVDKSIAIDLEETELDLEENERQKIKLNDAIQDVMEDKIRTENVAIETNQEMTEDIDHDMLLYTDAMDTDIDESMEISEIPPIESVEQAEEIIYIKTADDILEEDQQNVVCCMLDDLTGADEPNELALELISDIIMEPANCDVVTATNEAPEEFNQEVSKFNYDDGEENSQSSDVIIETTVKVLNSEAKSDVPSDTPDVVPAPEGKEMEIETITTVLNPVKAVQNPVEAVLVTEESSQAADEGSLAADEASLVTEEAILAAEEAILAAEEASLAAEEASLAAEEASLAAEEASLADEEASLAAEEASLAFEEASLAAEEASLAAEKASVAAKEASVVAEESSLVAEESSLVAGEASLAEEDTSQAAEKTTLGAEETSLATQETSLAAEETSLAAEEANLAADEADLDADEASLAADETSLAADEASLAADESNLATDEASLAAVEASLAADEAILDALEASLAADEVSPSGGEATVAAKETTIGAEEATVAAEETTLAVEEATQGAETATLAAETATVAAETATIAVEKTTVEAETATVAAETATVAAETATVAAETATVAAETASVTTETTTVAAEEITLAVDEATLEAETATVAAETATVAAETATVAAETATVAAETATVAAETATVAAETATVAAETPTVAAETATVAAETATVAAETATVTAEPDTVAAKKTTLAVDEATLGAETATVAAEETTAAAEETTLAAEEVTLGAETATEPAEETTLAVEEATLGAETATVEAEETAVAAEETTLAAKEVTLVAETATVAAEETTLAAEETTLGAETATLAADKTTLAAEKATVAVEEATVDREENVLVPADIEEAASEPENHPHEEVDNTDAFETNKATELINKPTQQVTSPESNAQGKTDDINDQSIKSTQNLDKCFALKSQAEATKINDKITKIQVTIKADKNHKEDISNETKITKEDSEEHFLNEAETTKENSQELTAKVDIKKLPAKEDIQELTAKVDIQTLTATEDIQKLTAKENIQKLTAKEDSQEITAKEDIQKLTAKVDIQTLTATEDIQNLTAKENIQELTAKEDNQELTAIDENKATTTSSPLPDRSITRIKCKKVTTKAKRKAIKKKKVAALTTIKEESLSEESRSQTPTQVLLPAKKTSKKSMKLKVPLTCKEKSAQETNDEQELKHSIVKTKDLLVRIKRLKVTDCKKLRQPRVFIKRVIEGSVDLKETTVKSSTKSNDVVSVDLKETAVKSSTVSNTVVSVDLKETAVKSSTKSNDVVSVALKETAVKSSTVSNAVVFVDLKETAVKSSTESNAVVSKQETSAKARPHRRILFKRQYSQSSTTSDDDTSKTMPKMKYARKQTAKRRYVPTGRPLGRPRKLIATPSSESGLKMRISSTSVPAGASSKTSTSSAMGNIELIHISSSSSPEFVESSDDEPLPANFSSTVDPLYEEEIILCD